MKNLIFGLVVAGVLPGLAVAQQDPLDIPLSTMKSSELKLSFAGTDHHGSFRVLGTAKKIYASDTLNSNFTLEHLALGPLFQNGAQKGGVQLGNDGDFIYTSEKELKKGRTPYCYITASHKVQEVEGGKVKMRAPSYDKLKFKWKDELKVTSIDTSKDQLTIEFEINSKFTGTIICNDPKGSAKPWTMKSLKAHLGSVLAVAYDPRRVQITSPLKAGSSSGGD